MICDNFEKSELGSKNFHAATAVVNANTERMYHLIKFIYYFSKKQITAMKFGAMVNTIKVRIKLLGVHNSEQYFGDPG